MLNAEVNQLSGIDTQIIVSSQRTHSLDMVSMIMSDKDRINAIQANPPILEMSFERAYADTGINQNLSIAIREVVTITSETNLTISVHSTIRLSND